MSNPTELPDLDRLEELAKAAQISILRMGMNGRPKDYFALLDAMPPETVLALIALARRPPVPAQRPTDDELWDSTIRDRDTYHEWADKLADAIASYFGVDIGEHSNQNCPWHEALEAIESAEPARRAQPEGEAPQAVAVCTCPSGDGSLRWPCPAHPPAAQHAESGAPASGDVRQKFEAWAEDAGYPTRRGFGNANNYDFVETRRMWESWQAALVAQSQGAQAQCTIGVGDGSGRLFVHGDYDSIKAVQRIILENESLRATQQAAAPGASNSVTPSGEQLYVMVTKRFKSGSFPWSMVAESGKDAWSAAAAELCFAPDTIMARYGGTATSAPGTPEAPQTAAARDVLAERQRQVEVEGWTPARDDEYVDGQLASAAVAYAQAYTPYLVPSSWPWAVEWLKPADDRRNLVRAGALIVAEIERLDRATQLDGGQGEGLKRCAAGRDGECNHKECPQLRDNEPLESGRHCPLDQEGSESNG